MTSTPQNESTAAKADLARRLIAIIIDAVPVVIVSAIVGSVTYLGPITAGLLAGVWWLVRDGLSLSCADQRSPGKKIMGLRPVRLDGAPMSLESSIRRNLPLAAYCVGFLLWVVPILGWLASLPVFAVGALLSLVEAVLVVTDPEGRRLGDKLAGTKVVEAA